MTISSDHPGDTLLNAFELAISKSDLTSEQQSLVLLLAQLSSSPWKFDILWELWPSCGVDTSEFPNLAQALIPDANNSSIFLYGAAVFDDITVFTDIVGKPGVRRPLPPHVYRWAYVSIRPTTFRRSLDIPPRPPSTTTQEEYLERLVFVSAALQDSDFDLVKTVLEMAAERYEERGKTDGAEMCRQNGRILGVIHEEGAALMGSLHRAAMNLFFSVDSPMLAYEIALQWPHLYGSDFRQSLQLSGQRTNDDIEALSSFTTSLEKLEPFFWLNRTRPGIGSILASLIALRLPGPPPRCLSICPAEWIQAAQRSLVVVRDNAKIGPPLPEAYMDDIQETLVVAGHRLQSAGALNKAARPLEDNSNSNPMADAVMVQLEVSAATTRRARNETTHEEFLRELEGLADKVRAAPIVLQYLLMTAADTRRVTSTFRNALLRAVSFLAEKTCNPNIMRMAADAHPKSPEEEHARARAFELQGRPDLALVAWINAGVSSLNSRDIEGSLDATTHAAGLLDLIERGKTKVPANAVFDEGMIRVRVAELRAKALFHQGHWSNALEAIDEALVKLSANPSDDVATTAFDKFAPPDLALLQLIAADAADRAGDINEASKRAQEARRLAEEAGDHEKTALALLKLSTFSYRAEDAAQRLAFLVDAQQHVDRHRRSLPFELDKVQTTPELGFAYIWASEMMIQTNPWDALAAFEGFRSRALLDQLAFSPATRSTAHIEQALLDEGAPLLQRIRSIIYPNNEDPFFVIHDQWLQALESLDSWLDKVAEVDADYSSVLRGASLTPDQIQRWAASVERPTAVLEWLLGEEYSYVCVLRAAPGEIPERPRFVKIDLTISWLQGVEKEWTTSLLERSEPSTDLIETLSMRIFQPVADALTRTEVVYLSPSRSLVALPLHALPIEGTPLCFSKEVAYIPSLSVLATLERIVSVSESYPKKVLFGPEFPEIEEAISRSLYVQPVDQIVLSDGAAPTEDVRQCDILHFICHGYHDARDPWQSGLVFAQHRGNELHVSGRTIMQWQLFAHFAVLQACDTRRQVMTATDDGFGIGRFLHVAGVPTLLLSDWEIRADVSTHFMQAFYRELLPALGKPRLLGIGRAYKLAMQETSEKYGSKNFLLWAPFALSGVVR